MDTFAFGPRKKKWYANRIVVGFIVGTFLLGAGALAAWLTSGQGPGYVRAGTLQPLVVVTQAPADIAGTCFPGQDCNVSVKIQNDNSGPLTIRSAVAGGGGTSSTNSACLFDLTYTDQTGLSLGPVPAETTQVIAIPNAAHLNALSDTACQGNLWTLQLIVTGSVG